MRKRCHTSTCSGCGESERETVERELGAVHDVVASVRTFAEFIGVTTDGAA